MMGVSRILRGGSVTNLLGDEKISPKDEKSLRRKYTLRALETLQMEIKDKKIFTLDGTIEKA
jgi:hypothetical protein